MCSLEIRLRRHWLTVGMAAWITLGAPFLLGEDAWQGTALDAYVHAPDPHYEYHLVRTLPGQGYTSYVLEMTSQSWRASSEVDRTLWKHWLTILEPDQVSNRTGLLFITGGNNNQPAPEKPDGNLARVAVATKTVVAELRMVPNQPLTFKDDGEPRTEDALIAYTWDKFLHTGDSHWPARLPMTKSAVRAMDTVTAFCQGNERQPCVIEHFVVAGASKRGWTTWTTAAVDKRVVGIVPIVIDVLNVEPSFDHHYQAYGFFAPAVHNYEEMHLMDWQGTPEYRALMKIEEPYEYRSRFTMPKLLINACGDQFFLPDSSQFYFKDLPGVKYLRYVPNADHSLRGSDAFQTLLAWYAAIIHEAKLPQFSWSADGGTLRVRSKERPERVILWQATDPKARDFRLEAVGPIWTSAALAANASGEYVGTVSAPATGWTAFLIELTFDRDDLPAPLKLTTDVHVIPDTLPFKKYQPKIGNRESPAGK